MNSLQQRHEVRLRGLPPHVQPRRPRTHRLNRRRTFPTGWKPAAGTARSPPSRTGPRLRSVGPASPLPDDANRAVQHSAL